MGSPNHDHVPLGELSRLQRSVQDLSTLPPYVLELKDALGYLSEGQVERVLRAYVMAACAHDGQSRASGEPYITHPIKVAVILAELRVDTETIIAAILHDTLEDTSLDRSVLTSEFGATVTELVDGVTKLDKVDFGSRQEAAAESFRKMLLAMARDLRVILIKLADRVHNMRTLGAKRSPSRRRIARETLEIYAPIAQHLGMNKIKAELQDLSFRALYPDRYRIISERIRAARGNRREVISKIETALKKRLVEAKLSAQVVGRIKSPWSIYSKMRSEDKSFAQLMDVYGVRVVVESAVNCYMALGVVHELYRPMDRRFKDFIAIPKANGYQSLHTVLMGPFGTPIEVQIRTVEMDAVAESGAAAHYAYKTHSGPANNAQARARAWVSNLANHSVQTTSSVEFIENVKVDLFPNEVYLFTPRGDILALPRHATALDFAYAVHTDVGTHAVAARIDKKLLPLRTRLESGQLVEIITAPSAMPSPSWLEMVVTGKARTAIRHYLKHMQYEDAVNFGHRMIDSALSALGSSLDMIPVAVLNRFLETLKFKRLEDLLSDIALGNRMPDQVARKLVNMRGLHAADQALPAYAMENIHITGNERGVLSFANCCHPLPGDDIIGHLSQGKGTVVHRAECPNAVELSKLPERCVGIEWGREAKGSYRCELRAEVMNHLGVLATVAAAITASDSNIENVEYVQHGLAAITILFTIEVRSRKHLADVMRRIRRTGMVSGVYRYPL